MSLSAVAGPVIASGISAGGGIIGSVVNGANSSHHMRVQARLNQEAIDKQNAYNTPLNQRKRFEEAGINPYLAMSDGGNQTSAPQSSMAAPDVGGPIANGFFGAAQMLSNIGLQQAQIRKTNAEATTQEINNETQGMRNELDLDILKQQKKDWTFKVDNLNSAELQKLNAETDLLIKQKLTEIAKADNLDALTDKIFEEIKGVKLDNDMKAITKEQLKERLELERNLLRMEGRTMFMNAVSQRMTARGALMNAQASLTNADSNSLVAKAQSALMGAQRGNVQIDTLNKGISAVENLFGVPARLKMLYGGADMMQKQLDSFDTDKFFDRAGRVISGGSEVSGNIRDWKLQGPQYGQTPYNETTTHYNGKGKVSKKTVKRGVRFGRLK